MNTCWCYCSNITKTVLSLLYTVIYRGTQSPKVVLSGCSISGPFNISGTCNRNMRLSAISERPKCFPQSSSPDWHQPLLRWRFFFNKILKKTYRWLTDTWKDAQHHSLSEKCKSKPQWGTITHQSGWLLSKSLQAINAGEGVEKREPSYTVGGNAN